MRRFALFIVVILALPSWFGVGAAPRSAATPPRLRLHRATFDARAAGRAAPTAALAAAASGPYTVIQFRGPIAPADRTALEQTGVTLLEYLPDYAYLVRGDAAQLAAAARLPQVYARASFALADKLAPPLLRALARGDAALGPLRIIAWPGAEDTLQRDLRALRGVRTSAPATELLQVAGLASVRWIEPIGRPRLLNDVARSIMQVDTAAWQGQGLFGDGQIVAVADSGLDTGIMATMSPDFAGRIVATHVLSAGGELGDQHGHGTHVAGSVAGAGVQSGANPTQRQYAGSFAGIAPEAQLVIQAFEALPDGSTVGIPSDYYTLFQQAYNDGARIHTNSWGDYTGPITDTEASFSGYPFGAQRTDQFVWDHPDMAVFFAAGNSGADGTPGALGFCTGGDGVVDPDSLLSPGTSKNVVTVGAAESQRATGGLSAYPWLLFSFCFSAQPISTDLVSNNAGGMAAFSSRGPTDDGRAKPDIVAPGTNIVSNKSHYPNAGSLWGAYDSNYEYSGGTSMATPLAAGAGVLVREWLVTRGIANPSGAAVKAILLNTTHDMAPGQYGAGATQEIPSARPNSVAGWGRVDLGFMDAPGSYAIWIDDHTAGLATGQQVSYADTAARPLEVLDSSQPLRVMLAWTDPPASLSAAQQLVNDLDLRVIGPGGTVYYGNNVSSGDRINNVEGIVINNPPVGQYSVEVRGFNVPIAAQPYALAVAGPLAAVGQMTLTKTANPATYVQPGGLITYTLALSADDHGINTPVTLTDTLPLQTAFVSASHGGAPIAAGSSVIEWAIPSIAPNTTIMRTLVVRVADNAVNNTSIVNSAYRAENGVDLPGIGQPVSVIVDAPPTQPGTLALAKTANTSVVAPGGLITYTLQVGAQGGPLSGVVLSDTLPVSTTFVSASGAYTRSGPNNNLVAWPLGGLVAGQTVMRTLTVQVPPSTPDGTTISNVSYQAAALDAVAISGAPVLVAVDAPPPQPGTLALAKTANSSVVAPGGLITYTLQVGAQGGPLSGVVLSDVLPANTTFVSASGAYTRSGPSNSLISWPVGDLAAGQTVARTLIVRVLPTASNGATISNANYSASAAGVASISHPPVNVTLQAPPPPQGIWLPLVAR
jgi:uncharacterized repeat protein (TIGR01451 family)